MTETETTLLRHAVELARRSVAEGGGPFGAVVADGDGRIIGEGSNRVTRLGDPTAHAEIAAIREACARRGDHCLSGLVLYCSCEPCPMCLAAAWWARLDAVLFASDRHAAAAAGFDDALLWQAMRSGSTEGHLTLRHLRLPAAGSEFRDWLEKPDRVPY